MDWIKIPTDCILHPEYKDSDLILLIRYQALYCQLEKEPTEAQISQHFTPKQTDFLRKNVEILEDLVKNQIKNVREKRKRDKVRYETKQQVGSFSVSGTLANRQRTVVAEERRGEEIREDKNKEEETGAKIISPFEASVTFTEFWETYPKQTRRGFALEAYRKALSVTDHKTIMDGLKKYQFPKELIYAPKPEDWLKGECWLDRQSNKNGKLFVVGVKKSYDEMDAEERKQYLQELHRKCAMV